MTREQVRDVLPLLQAYAEGKAIQYRCDGKYGDIKTVLLGELEINSQRYRIKPEPKYRPFANAEECWQEMQKHQPFGWLKVQGQYRAVVRVADGVFQLDKADCVTYFYDGVRHCQFPDGTPFGIKE